MLGRLAPHASLAAATLSSALLIGADLDAQITSSAATSSTWNASATGGTTQTLPTGLAFPSGPPTQLSANGSTPACVPTQPATANAVAEVRYTATTLSYTTETGAGMPLRCVSPAQLSGFDGTLRWSLAAATPTPGVLRGTIRNPNVMDSQIQSITRAIVTEVATGTGFEPDPVGPITQIAQIFRLHDTWSFEWPVVLDTQPTEFDIRIENTASALALGSAFVNGICEVELEFVPNQTGAFTEFGSPCGPEFTGFTFERVSSGGTTVRESVMFSASSVPPATGHFFIFGTTDPNLPLFPTSCSLRTDLAVVVRIPPPAMGPTRWQLDLPNGFSGFNARGQFLAGNLSSGVAEWFTSEGFLLTL